MNSIKKYIVLALMLSELQIYCMSNNSSSQQPTAQTAQVEKNNMTQQASIKAEDDTDDIFEKFFQLKELRKAIKKERKTANNSKKSTSSPHDYFDEFFELNSKSLQTDRQTVQKEPNEN